MINENRIVIEKIDKILNELSLQTNIILDGIQKIYSYVNDVEVHYIMENMFKSSITLSKYINNLLDYKKYLISDNLILQNNSISILTLIKQIFTIYNVKMETYDIKLNYNLSNDIRDYNYIIDKKYLKQILLNIFDIIISDIESEILNLNNNKILIKVEYNEGYIEFNIYYTSLKNIDIKKIKDNVFDKYNIKYNIINVLVNHLKGDILYYNKLGNEIGYDKQITIKLLSQKKEINCNSNNEINNNTNKEEINNNTNNNERINNLGYNTINLAILSSNSLYLSIIINALRYYYKNLVLNIIPLDNIKHGFGYIKKNNKTIDFLILDVEYNNLLGLNILNNLYKYKNMKFILTTSIESENIKNYIGNEYKNERIFIYIKPINNHNISKIENFLTNKTDNKNYENDDNNDNNDDDGVDDKIIYL